MGRQSKLELAPPNGSGGSASFVGLLKHARLQALAGNSDAWQLRLERVRGKIGDDGIERVGTQTLFDFLEVPQRLRRPGACRRLATLMRELGWTPIKARGLTQGGFTDQVRGYARDKTDLTLT
jgi:hypothetical protein